MGKELPYREKKMDIFQLSEGRDVSASEKVEKFHFFKKPFPK